MIKLNRIDIPRDKKLRESKTRMLQSSLSNVKYSFLDKTGFIIKKIQNNIYPERFARKYFEDKGYTVIKEQKLKPLKDKKLIELTYCFFDFDEKKLKWFLHNLRSPGKPDFLVYNDYCFFFVEVKGEGGYIQKKQIEFLEYLNELKIPTFIFLAHNQEPLKQEISNE